MRQYTIGELKELLDKYKDDTIVVVEGPERMFGRRRFFPIYNGRLERIPWRLTSKRGEIPIGEPANEVIALVLNNSER